MPRILVVDDDRAMQETLAAVLRASGYEVDVCRDGKRVISELESTPTDLMILDVLIPHMNGFTVLEKLREHPTLRDLPVILISGIYRSRNHRSEMSQKYGIVEYLDKPIPTASLREWVEKTVGPGTRDDAPVTLDRPKKPVPLTQLKDEEEHDDETNPLDLSLVEPAAVVERSQVEKDARAKFQTSAFLFQGSIKRNPVAALLGRLCSEKTSGGLLLRREKVKKIIYLRDGEPIAVKSNLVGECLGRLLVRERLISEEECAASIRRMKESGQRQGEVLVEMRSMTEKNLQFALELQLESKLFTTFKWEDGEFRFNSSIKLPKPVAKLEWAGAALVVEGIRRAFDETRLRGLMLPILDVPLIYRQGEADLKPLQFTSVETKAATAMHFPATAREHLESAPSSPADTLRVLYTLIALQLVVPEP